jgi:glycosyltransferase involved in cell wall biosynthesis
MKILFLITRAERGGGQMHVLDLLRGYRNLYKCHLATGEPGFLCEMAEELGISVHILPSLLQPIRPLRDTLAVLQTIRLIMRIKPDAVHAHTSKAGLVARLAGAITGTPVIYTVHMWSFTEGFSRWRKLICLPLERICAPLSAKIITVSEANRQLALKNRVAPESRLTTVWNGVPDTCWRSDPAGGSPVRIVMVARFAAPKDQPLLVQALAEIEADFELELIGTGPELASVCELVHNLGIKEKVRFLMDRDDIAEILSRSHIFVLASNWEGLPLSILEAMRAGLPIIASDVGGVSELVSNNKNGILFPPKDKGKLRDALWKLIGDANLRFTMGQNSRMKYEAKFSYHGMLENTKQVYDQVLTIMPAELQVYS